MITVMITAYFLVYDDDKCEAVVFVSPIKEEAGRAIAFVVFGKQVLLNSSMTIASSSETDKSLRRNLLKPA